MALEIPWDVPKDAFTRAGLMTIDGDMFDQSMKVNTHTLYREVEYLRANIKEGNLQTQNEWVQVRNVTLLWCFSMRSVLDNKAINALFKHVGLVDISVPEAITTNMFDILRNKFNQARPNFSPPALWIARKPPAQRLPTRSSLPSPSQDYQHPTPPLPFSTATASSMRPNTQIAQTRPPPLSLAPTPTPTPTPRTSLGFNANPKFQGKYNFTDHRQEYDGHQFQCIFKCLKDGKHCRKAPVREMNRHLRSRHNFRPGFKIAGVDWEKKRWRGAGADHRECVGKIVEKDAADESENDESDLEYTMENI